MLVRADWCVVAVLRVPRLDRCYGMFSRMTYPTAYQANLSMFADDHQIYHTGADQAALTFQLKDSANLATTWYDSNLLAGNLKNYQVLNLGFIQNDSNICVNDVEIETKDNIKLLGV